MSSSDDPLQFDPTTKTKPQLQAWLVDHDQYPSRSNVTKDELIRLVREHQIRLRTRQTPTRTISSPQTKVEREHVMSKVKAIEALETPSKKLAVTRNGVLVEQWGAGWERATTIATPPSATSVIGTKGRTSLGTTATSTPKTSTSTKTSTVSTTGRKKRRLAERDEEDEEETSTSTKPTARKRAATSDHKYAPMPMRDENEMEQDIEPDIELPTKKRRVTKSFVAPDLLLPSAEAHAAHAPQSSFHKSLSDDNMHIDETSTNNNNNMSSFTVSPPKIPNPFQQAAFMQPETENGEQTRRSRASLPSESITRPTKRSTQSLGGALVRGEAHDEDYQSLFTPKKSYIHGVETPEDQERLSYHRPVMAELQQRLIQQQQQQQQQQHTSPQGQVQDQDHGLRQRVIRTSPQMDRIAFPPRDDGFIPPTPRTPESTSPRDIPPTPRPPIPPPSLLSRIHSYLSSTWSAFIHLLHFLLRMLVIILALILIVLVYQRYLHQHFRAPTKFCTSEGLTSNHVADDPQCVECPVTDPIGYCRNHDLICHSPYVRDGDRCVESKELQEQYYKLKDQAVWLLERTAGEYECGYHKNHGLTREQLREKLFQQYQKTCTNQTASPSEISQFDHAFPRMMKLVDSQLSTLSLEQQGYTYISQNPDRPIQCQIKELIMEHRTELAIIAFIITTMAWLYRTISLWRWRRAQIPLLERRIQSELLTSYEALAIDHLRDQLWRGQDQKVWERTVKRIAKDSRIQLTRQKKGGSTRDCWMWIASKPTLVNPCNEINPTQPSSSAGAEPTFAPATLTQ